MKVSCRSSQPSHLFVYGTLRRGGKSPFAQLLRARSLYAGEASIAGRLYRFGAFPGAVPDECCKHRVFGELYRLLEETILQNLDRYEGCDAAAAGPHLFRREIVRVTCANRQVIAAWVYAFRGEVAGRPMILAPPPGFRNRCQRGKRN
jgi:gamma-glutamylcyclotransferase (GGCT)/AIG2-like uncharacterized protein YtfP